MILSTDVDTNFGGMHSEFFWCNRIKSDNSISFNAVYSMK